MDTVAVEPEWLPILFTQEDGDYEFLVAADYLRNAAGQVISYLPGEAQAVAEDFQASLPTPRFVDALHNHITAKHIGFRSQTPGSGEGVSSKAHMRRAAEYELRYRAPGELLVDYRKDIVIGHVVPGKVTIYGAWPAGAKDPKQTVFGGHSSRYTDYSHGTRLVQRDVRTPKGIVDLLVLATEGPFPNPFVSKARKMSQLIYPKGV